jgi:hypothetical protein
MYEPYHVINPISVTCPNCGCIELLYRTKDYQEIEYWRFLTKQMEMGNRSTDIASFGGYGSGKSKASLQEFFLAV